MDRQAFLARLEDKKTSLKHQLSDMADDLSGFVQDEVDLAFQEGMCHAKQEFAHLHQSETASPPTFVTFQPVDISVKQEHFEVETALSNQQRQVTEDEASFTSPFSPVTTDGHSIPNDLPPTSIIKYSPNICIKQDDQESTLPNQPQQIEDESLEMSRDEITDQSTAVL